MQTIKSRGLSALSLYKLLCCGLFVPIFLFALGCGIASMFGYSTVSFNGEFVYGMQGMIVSVVLGLLLPIFMAFFLWIIIGIGVWLWTRFRTIDLSIKE